VLSHAIVAAALLLAEVGTDAPLIERHRDWLERDVAPIISDAERQAFVQLPDDATRDRFVEGFWAARDPTPETDANERRIEHERRLVKAQVLFGKKGRPVVSTARGRLWVQLGEPIGRVRYPHDGRVYPIEHWLYQGKQEFGLPSAFYAVFFQPFGAGDWRLYDPVADGPERLTSGIASGRRLRRSRASDPLSSGGESKAREIGGSSGPPPPPVAGGGPDPNLTDFGAGRRRSLITLREVSVTLRDVSLSLDPADTVDTKRGKGSPESARIVGRLHEIQNYQPIDIGWVARLLGAEEVQVERTVALLAVRAFVQPSFGVVHYLVELPAASLTLTQIGDQASGAVELIGDIVVEGSDDPVIPIEVRLPIQIGLDELALVRSHPLVIVDALALRPGRHRLRLRVTDVGSGSIGVIDEPFVAPVAPDDGVALGPILLASHAKAAPASADAVRPFVLRGQQIVPAVGGELRAGPRVSALFEASSAAAVAQVAQARYVIEGADGPVRDETLEIEVVPVRDGRAVIQFEPSLRGLAAGRYTLRAEVAGARTSTALMVIEQRTPSPWILIVERDRGPGVLALELSRQLMAVGDDGAALRTLDAVETGSDEVSFEVRIRRAEIRLRRGDHAAAAAALAPDGGGERATAYTMLLLAVARSAAGDGPGAIGVLARAAERFPADVRILNLLGEEHLRAGDRSAARATFERSLGLDPEQAEIRELAATLR